jgi:site-specific recombinase XerD
MKKSSRPIIEHITDFLDWLEIEEGLSSKTQENYSRFLNKFINWLKENNYSALLPHQLSSDHIWKYRVYLSRHILPYSGQSLKKSTQNYYLIALRSLLNYFANRDILSLPSEKIKLAKDKKDKKISFLSLDQLKKLLNSPDTKKISGLRDRAILETLFSTGLRVSELISLNRDQFKIKSDSTDFELSISGKGNRIRTVYFSERAAQWLKKYLHERADLDKALFVNFRGRKNAPKRLTVRSVERLLKKYVIMAGLPLNTSPHTLRHSFATDLLNQGVDLRIIQEFLGHQNIATTQIYTHVTNRQLRDVHRKYHSGSNLSD